MIRPGSGSRVACVAAAAPRGGSAHRRVARLAAASPNVVSAPTRVAELLLVVVLAIGGWLATASPAAAHNVLRSTSPSDRSVVDRVPGEVVLTFDEPALAMGTALVVIGPGGPVQDGAARLIDNTVHQSLLPSSPAGAYTVEWRVTSADGHPVSGTFTFTARAAGDASASPAAAPSQVTSASGDDSSTTGHGVPAWLWAVVVVLLALAGVTSIVLMRRRQAPR